MISPHGQHLQSIPGSRVQVFYGAGHFARIGEIAKSIGGTRALLVSDAGIREAGHVETAVRSLYRAKVAVRLFDEVGENPTIIHVGKGVIAGRPFNADLIIALGGGSVMDCAKGMNLLLTHGGRMQDYWGIGKASQPMLPMIAIPTTAGTGSDARSDTLITDPETQLKMSCGDPKALPRIALLDPNLTATQPPKVAAASALSAVAQAIESAGSNKRDDASRRLSIESWRLLESSFEQSLKVPSDVEAGQRMLLGAHLAGAAVENSSLGATHALAIPLTTMFGVVHGLAVSLMLPHVIRFNSEIDQRPYSDLHPDAEILARRVEQMLAASGLPKTLAEVGVSDAKLPELAAMAATHWTITSNPRLIGEADLLAIYRRASAGTA